MQIMDGILWQKMSLVSVCKNNGQFNLQWRSVGDLKAEMRSLFFKKLYSIIIL